MPRAAKPVPPPHPRSFADPKVRDAFFKALARTGVVSASAAIAGVHRHTIGNEAERDPKFAAEVERFRNSAKASFVEAVLKGFNKDWRAAAWLLERMWPQEFGARDPDSVTPEQVVTAVNRVASILWPLIPADKQDAARAAMESIAGNLTTPQAEKAEHGQNGQGRQNGQNDQHEQNNGEAPKAEQPVVTVVVE